MYGDNYTFFLLFSTNILKINPGQAMFSIHKTMAMKLTTSRKERKLVSVQCQFKCILEKSKITQKVQIVPINNFHNNLSSNEFVH